MIRLIIDNIDIQNDLNGKVDLTGNQTISGEKTFADNTFIVSDLLVGSGNVNILDELSNKVSLTGTETINGDKTFVGSIIVNNLTTTGSTSFLNTEQVLIEDNEIYVNSNVTGSPSIDGYFGVIRGTEPNAVLKWDEGNNQWELGVSGNTSDYIKAGSDVEIKVSNDLTLLSNYSAGISGARIFMDGSSGEIELNIFDGSAKLSSPTVGDMRLVIDRNSLRPGVDLTIGGVLQGTIFSDGGGFGTGSNNSLAIRAGGSANGVHLPSGGTSWATHSDSRVKKNIINIKYGLSDLLKLEPKNFDYSNDTTDDSKRLGLIAQEVLTHIPCLVQGNGDQPDGTYSITYSDLIPIIIQAIKELKTQIDNM